MGCLYMLTSPSGKSYIGITSKTAQQRFKKHVEHAFGKRENGVIYSALRKYKPEGFAVKTLAIADWSYLVDLEQKAIVAFGTRYPKGYNMTDGGEGTPGWVASDAARVRMSEGQKRRFARDPERIRMREHRQKAHEALRAKHEVRRINGMAPWEVRERESRSRQGSDEHKAKISAGTKAAMARPEIAAKVQQCAVDRAANPEWRKKIGDSKRGKLYGKRSEEFVDKQVAGIKAAWADPEKKAARLRKNAEARKLTKPGIDLTCGNCGKVFNVPEWVARSKQPKNCSRACYFKSKSKGREPGIQMSLIPTES
jgi:hypothetical protein